MDRDEILATIRGFLVKQMDVEADAVTMEARFQEDLDADSLDLVELIMELEDAYGVKISDEEAEKIKTVGDAVEYIVAHAG